MPIVERYGTVLRCYDNGGKTTDRYSVVPPRWAHQYRNQDRRHLFHSIGASASPYSPLGVGYYDESTMPGAHLGKRIRWDELPSDVQRFARESFPEYAPA